MANSQGLLMMELAEFDSATITLDNVVSHEMGHGIFETHNVYDDATATRVPDDFALAFADLYVRLDATTNVPNPTAKFDPKHPPSTTLAKDNVPAGLAMVKDVLWSGYGGHPENVDEFFASAYAGFVQNKKLLATIIAYYAKHADPSLTALGKQLFALLGAVGDTKKLAKVKPPKDTTNASAELQAIGRTPDESAHAKLGTASRYLVWLLDPSTLPTPGGSLKNCP